MSALIRADIVAEARSWVGTPYRHQASLKGVGCDCLGLVRGVWRALLGAEPELPGAYGPGWAEAGGGERLLLAAQRHCVARETIDAGDLLLFRWRADMPAKHIGIATSAAHFIHAQDGACICEVALSPWWHRRLAGVFALPGVG
jgi:NlpC/P60 family putative phage cell wall peptidase